MLIAFARDGVCRQQVDPSARKWNAILYSNRAAAHMALGMHADAAQDCNQAIAKDPDFSKAYLRRARAYRVRHAISPFCSLPCYNAESGFV